LGSFETRTRFPVCKLVRKLETDWRDDQSLPVLVARAQLAGLRTAGDPEARYQAKWQLVRGLYAAGYNADEVRELFRLLDWMLHLRPDLGRKFERDLVELEEELHMPYVTSVERIAEERGLEKGRTEGLQKGLQKGIRLALKLKFGEAGLDLMPEIAKIEDPRHLKSSFRRSKPPPLPNTCVRSGQPPSRDVCCSWFLVLGYLFATDERTKNNDLTPPS
jgi:hypothetical protein